LGKFVKLESVSLSGFRFVHFIYASTQEMSKAERLLSYSLLSLITGKPLASAPMNGIGEDDNSPSNKGNGIVNPDGAWCWRQECQGLLNCFMIQLLYRKKFFVDCLRLTKAIQKMSDMLQSTADLYDDHVSLDLCGFYLEAEGTIRHDALNLQRTMR
jgi:hypothetical protein